MLRFYKFLFSFFFQYHYDASIGIDGEFFTKLQKANIKDIEKDGKEWVTLPLQDGFRFRVHSI